MSALPSILLLIVLIGSNAFFAMSEIAILSANSNKMKKLAENGNKRAALLLKITDEPSDFLATIQVRVTLSGFLASAVAAENFAGYFDRWLSFLPISPALLHSIVLVLLTILLSYFTLIFGELTPKRIAMKFPDEMALGSVGILWAIYKFCRPFIRLLSASTNGLLRLLRIKPEDDEEKVTEEEILLMVEAGEEKGSIDREEKDFITNLFQFQDQRVSALMTHRTEICAVPDDTPISGLIEVTEHAHYSRIPVYEDSIDNIIGVLYIKDLVPLLKEEPFQKHTVREFIRPVLYVPQTLHSAQLLRQFREQKIHIAVVVDEYGGTAGIITMEDLLESIVGEIDDEYDRQDDETTQESAPESPQKLAARQIQKQV